MTVMITNGPDHPVHSPDYHAEITAAKIFSIAEATYPEKVTAVREVRKAVEAALIAHHSHVHNDESGKLETHGLEHCDCDLDSAHHDDSCVQLFDEVLAAVRGTPFEHIFQRDDVRTAIIADLHHETRSQMNVHRETFKARGGRHTECSKPISAVEPSIVLGKLS